MQIHELDNYNGELNSGAYVVVDNGTDTGKVSIPGFLAETNGEISQLAAYLNGRIDNIIAGGAAPSASEIVDARYGDDGITYPSLGDAIRNQVGDLKSDISESLIGLENFRQFAPFEHYGLNPDGTYLTSQQYRVSCDTHITLDRAISISVASGFKWGYIRFVNGAVSGWSGWITSDIALPSGIEFVVQIARITENTSEIANVGEFVSAVTFNTIAKSNDDAILNSIAKGYIPFAQADITYGNWNDNGGITYNYYRLCTKELVPIKAGDIITFKTNNLQIAFGIYVNGAVTEYSGWLTASSEKSYTFLHDGLFFASFKKSNDADLLVSDFDAVCKLYTGVRNEISKIENEVADIRTDIGVNRQLVKLANGTPINAANTQCVYTTTKILAKANDRVRIITDRPLSASAVRYIFGVYCYDASDNLLSQASPTARQDLTSDYVVEDERASYIRYAITEVDGSGNVISVRETDFLNYDTTAIIDSNVSPEYYTYKYSGDYVDIRPRKYNAIYTKIKPPTASSLGSNTLQGFAMYKGKAIQLFAGDSKLAIVNMSDSSVVATMDGHVGHGNTIDFFNEFENEGDMFPLALVADGLTNEAYKVRIQTSGVTVKQTIKFPIEHCGYYVSTMLDKLNQIIYTVGYYEDSYNTDSGSNKMVIAKWDYTNLTANGDGSVTPAFVESFYVPYFTTLQGPTFFNGKLFVISSKSSATEADTKIFVIDPYEKRICTIITDFPYDLKNIEVEGIFFYEDEDGGCGYMRNANNSAGFWKLEFA